MDKLLSLGEVLVHINECHWEDFLYAEGRPPWTVETRCVVIERDPYSDELPEAAKALSLVPVLQVSDVKSVVRNAKQQRPDVSTEDLVRALTFYFQKDAYIDFGLES
ncbi:hypothetical protein QEG98_10045 [Myxococcus sp. MxC21-1]|uniref:DUF7716 domain-containing protein n=1 Tax=Myxococcus sp. MxC21-1 TaxID=3041439 RepID=UPI00292FB175|nr:hypothetical protein [Myxococcus sp. MxC21-1]WNZ63997.1 hypothetical protein QEG98_10045 [Myxococcus sp. MxC21-1]